MTCELGSRAIIPLGGDRTPCLGSRCALQLNQLPACSRTRYTHTRQCLLVDSAHPRAAPALLRRDSSVFALCPGFFCHLTSDVPSFPCPRLPAHPPTLAVMQSGMDGFMC